MTTNTPANTLTNPLATPAQLTASSSSLDGVSQSVEHAARFAGASLTQAAGVLLRLPQDVVARAIVLFTRFWVGPEGGSFKEFGAADISAACLYLTAKPSVTPKSPRSILNVYAYLAAHPPTSRASSSASPSTHPDPNTYYLSEGAYAARRTRLHSHETLILRTLSFVTHVALPHSLCINYLQTLDVFATSSSSASNGDHKPSATALASRALAHLNAALLSPQLLYLTHQPHVLATAAIYLAAREVGWKLPEEEWWAVFDTEREELGFVVVGMLSLEGWVRAEREKWGGAQDEGGEGKAGKGIWSLLTVDGVMVALEKEQEDG